MFNFRATDKQRERKGKRLYPLYVYTALESAWETPALYT